MTRLKIMVPVVAVLSIACAPPQSELGISSYEYSSSSQACVTNVRAGPPGHTDAEQSARGINFNVRTPANYDPKVVHPLLMVFSPGDRDAVGTERMTDLTTSATGAGFVVAYADNRPRGIPSGERPISMEWIVELGTIPSRIAERWCIDEERIYLTGHSNGGTVATALALLAESQVQAAAIAPSGAGFDAKALAGMDCPETPVSAFVMHSADDRLFPDFGAQAASWWADCNACDVAVQDASGCQGYTNCTNGAAVRYCEGSGRHTRWPHRNDELLKFFSPVSAPRES